MTFDLGRMDGIWFCFFNSDLEIEKARVVDDHSGFGLFGCKTVYVSRSGWCLTRNERGMDHAWHCRESFDVTGEACFQGFMKIIYIGNTG